MMMSMTLIQYQMQRVIGKDTEEMEISLRKNGSITVVDLTVLLTRRYTLKTAMKLPLYQMRGNSVIKITHLFTVADGRKD